MTFMSEPLRLLEEVFELEQELLLRRVMFVSNGVKYEYPPPYLQDAMELYADVEFLKVRLLELKAHITYTDELLNKYKHKIDYDYEKKKQEKWKQNFWKKLLRGYI